MKTTPERRETFRKAAIKVLADDGWICSNDCARAMLMLLGDLESAERELANCVIAARSYEKGVATGEPFGDAIKAVLICRQSLDAAIARYTEAERDLAEQRERAEVAEEALGMACEDAWPCGQTRRQTLYLKKARARIASRKEIADGHK